MKKFLKSVLLFSIPFILWVLIVFFINPFNYYGSKEEYHKDKVQYEIGNQINNRLFKLIKFSKAPNSRVILGDSRTYALSEDVIMEISGIEFTNMSFGGNHFGEMCETFWHLLKNYDFDEVYWGLSFFNLSKGG